ncbi:MAG TPA: MFS transporter [Gemmatimonadota bacterium]|nr:MFS transporter [Gemmatimonadota bacterium]
MSNEPGRVERREIGSWCLYDFANSAFTTLIVTFIFSEFFTRVIAADNVSGTVIWSRAVNISAIIVALSTPVLGAIADFSRRKKLFLLLATLQTIIFTAFLFFMGPGMAFAAAFVFVIANVGFEGANVFYNAFLPEIATSKNMGRISGYGWALGYVGGLLALVIALQMVQGWLPDDGYLNVRSTTLLVAVWYAVFSIPLFVWLRERGKARHVEPGTYMKEGFVRVGETFRHLRRYREAAKLLLARLVYNDGLVTIFSFGAIYASAVFGMQTADVIKLGITLNVTAAIGAFALGYVNDWIGGKPTIAITLVVLIVAALVGATAETRTGFWIAAVGIGLMVGPNQAASRSLLGVMIPEEKHGEFFGFFAFSGKLASVAGPFVYGSVVGATGSHRIAMASIVVFFILGLILLMTVDEKGGIAAARGGQEESPATFMQ